MASFSAVALASGLPRLITMRDFLEVSELASKQRGVVSRVQLTTLGFKRSSIQRAVRDRLLVPVLRGVYRLASAQVSRELQFWAALAYAGRDAVLSHRSAAWVWKLEGLGPKPPDITEILIPARWQRGSIERVRIRQSRILERGKDFATLHGFPVTSLARTVVDLASVLPPKDLEHAFDSAVRRGEHVRKAIHETLVRLDVPKHEGLPNLATIANRYELGCTQSWLEDEIRQLLREENIPLPLPQLAIPDADNRQICISDFAWPEHRVVICADSRKHHLGAAPFEGDRRIWTRLSAAGWHPLIVTWHQIKNERDELVTNIRRALGLPVCQRVRVPNPWTHREGLNQEAPPDATQLTLF